MHKTKLFLVIFIFNFTLQSNAQIWQKFKDDGGHFFNTGKELTNSMLNANNNDYLNFALISAGVAGISLLDKTTRSFALDHQTDFNNSLFSIDKYYGSKWYMLSGMSVVYFAGLFSKQKEIRETGLLTAEAYFYTAVITVVTKEIFGRSRPYLDSGPYSFKPFSFNERNRSFFSGHSSTVFAVSTVMASRIDNWFWKISWYAAAVLTAGARMYHDKHWLSDVTAGAIVGYAIGNYVLNRNGKRVRISPGATSDKPMMIGLSIRLD